MHTHIKAVILDMDGLLVDSERVGRESFVQAFELYKAPYTEALFEIMVGRSAQASLKLMEAYLENAELARKIWDQADIYYDTCVHAGNIGPKAGVYELIDFLERKQLPWAIATASNQIHAEAKLSAIGILNKVPYLVTVDQVERPKPEPDLFLKAAALLGIEPSRACIVLEDSEVGVRGASAAGMLPIMIPDVQVPSAHIRTVAHTVLPSLVAFLEYFEEHFQIVSKH